MSSIKQTIDVLNGQKIITTNKTLAIGERGAILHYCPRHHGDYPPPPGVPGVAVNMVGPPDAGGHHMYPILLLFNCVDIPATASITLDPEFVYLFEQGHTVNSQIVMQNVWNNEMIRRDAYDVWRVRNHLEPGGWSMWCMEGDDPIPESEADIGLGFQLTLQNILMVPDPNVPIEDIMRFRDRRRSELMALRHHIDQVCIDISKNGADLRESRLAIERFEAALNDHLRVSKEPNWKKMLATLHVSMNWTNAVFAAIAVGGAASSYPLVNAASAGLAGSLVVQSTRGLKTEKSKSPFAYMAQIRSELLV